MKAPPQAPLPPAAAPSSAWVLEILAAARRFVAALPKSERQRIDGALSDLAAQPHGRHDLEPLGRPGWFRYRIGRWRAIVELKPDARIVVVALIRPRGDVYGRRTQHSIEG